VLSGAVWSLTNGLYWVWTAKFGVKHNSTGDWPTLPSGTEFGLLASKPCASYGDLMRDNIRLVSTAGTGFTYYTTKNKRTQQGKLELKKYDPKVRKHVMFKEAKMPPHSK